MTTTERFQSARVNAHEALNRARKVLALCNAIPFAETHEQVERTAEFFEELSDRDWERLARHAGVNPPSVTTRAAVVQVLRNRQPIVEVR